MDNDKPVKPKAYKLTEDEQKAALSFGNAVAMAKLNVYAANVALEEAKARTGAACSAVDAADARFNAVVGFLAQSHGITNWRISQDFSQIEESQ